jgi:hypothetical protein
MLASRLRGVPTTTATRDIATPRESAARRFRAGQVGEYAPCTPTRAHILPTLAHQTVCLSVNHHDVFWLVEPSLDPGPGGRRDAGDLGRPGPFARGRAHREAGGPTWAFTEVSCVDPVVELQVTALVVLANGSCCRNCCGPTADGIRSAESTSEYSPSCAKVDKPCRYSSAKQLAHGVAMRGSRFIGNCGRL